MGKPILAPAWRNHHDGTREFDLAHLHPHKMSVSVPAKLGRPALNLTIFVSFSLHCFTRGIQPGQSVSVNDQYSDNREQRVFDEVRWELSRELPSIVASLPSRPCFRTDHEEFLTIDLIQNGIVVTYTVFFTVGKFGKRYEEADLWLFINSAHPRASPLPRVRDRRIHFMTILGRAYSGRS